MRSSLPGYLVQKVGDLALGLGEGEGKARRDGMALGTVLYGLALGTALAGVRVTTG